MIPKQTKVAGGITLSAGGIIATLSAADAAQWLELITQYVPLILSGILLYALWDLRRQHDTCQKNLIEMHKKLSSLSARLAVIEGRIPQEHNNGHE